MSADMRPMEWGEIIERAFRFYRGNFLRLYLLFLVPQLLIWIETQVFQGPINRIAEKAQHNPEAVLAELPALLVPMTVLMVTGLLVASLQHGAMALQAGSGLLGRPLSLGEAWSGALMRLPSVLVALVAASLVTTLVTLVGCVMLCLPGVLALVFFSLVFYLVVPAIVIDDAGPFAALGRSYRFMMTSVPGGMHPMLKGLILGVLLLAIGMAVQALGGLPNMAVSIAAGMQGAASGTPPTADTFSSGPMMLVMAATTLFATVVGALVPPLRTVVAVLLYYDLKLRHEGMALDAPEVLEAPPPAGP